MFIPRIKYYFLAISILFSFFSIAQNKGCIDSISFNKYYNQYFADMSLNPAQRDDADNFYLSASTVIGGNNYASIIKFNVKNQLLWYKNYISHQFFTEILPESISSIDNNANLFFSSSGLNNITGTYQSFISKTDSTGNFLWGRRIERTDAPSIKNNLYNNNGGTIADDGSTFYLHLASDDFKSAGIVKVDPNGNIKWNKRFGNIVLPQFRILENIIAYQESDTIVLFSHFYYDAAQPTDANSKQGIQMVKINTANGSLMSQKTMMYYYDSNGNQANRIILKKLNYDKTYKQFLLDSRGQIMVPVLKSHIISLLDENFNPVKSNYFTTTNFFGTEDIRISNDNKITVTNRTTVGLGPTEITYATFSNNAEIIAQRKIELSAIGFPNSQFISNVTFKQNGILNFQLGLSGGNSVGNPIFLFDHSPFYQGVNNCLGYDTTIYTKSDIYTLPITGIAFDEFNGLPLQSTVVSYTDPILDLQMPKTELCKEVSICDTIKLSGNNYHCLSNPFDSFKIIRNPLCKRITNWQVDTNYIKILSQNDTSLYVQYLKAYRGNIKVGFGGCSLTDEIPIEVYAAKTTVNLGNDTMYCPGKSITLHTGGGFKTYQWQDGSTLDSLVATQPGLYYVTVTDSCGNIFKDSININPIDVQLQLDYPKQICIKDTVTFTLPVKLYNYNWMPTNTASLNNLTWRLYPSATTIYNISGERLPGCIISDTVLINVKTDCVPDYIYFPNAFTPNNDGINDTYKPGINGVLTDYELWLYNRYGQLVFKTSDPFQGWNGHFKNNKSPLPGGYIWICRYRFAGKSVQQEKGSFTLIR